MAVMAMVIVMLKVVMVCSAGDNSIADLDVDGIGDGRSNCSFATVIFR